MTELLKLLGEGRAWSVEDLAGQLHQTPEQIGRQIEFLEQTGYLRRVGGCGHDCKGCSAHCGAGAGLGSMPVFWEVTGR